MAVLSFNAVGFAAHYSKHGDWAFDYALKLSESSGMQLNVFHFLSDPYDKSENEYERLAHRELEKIAIQKEKELRLYYDKRSGEYLKVGFRVCYDRSWTELHRCLLIREFQVLVLGYTEFNAYFARYPIEEFAEKFISPVVLVGPDRPDQFFLNHQAVQLVDKLGLENKEWIELEAVTA
jgi:hypothetical protein